jgi:hypothetical protein
VADVLAHEVVARRGDELPFAHVAELVEDLGHSHGDGGLAGPRPPGERHVQWRRLGREPHHLAQLVDQEQVRDFANPVLDGGEPDQLPIELRQHLADL